MWIVVHTSQIAVPENYTLPSEMRWKGWREHFYSNLCSPQDIESFWLFGSSLEDVHSNLAQWRAMRGLIGYHGKGDLPYVHHREEMNWTHGRCGCVAHLVGCLGLVGWAVLILHSLQFLLLVWSAFLRCDVMVSLVNMYSKLVIFREVAEKIGQILRRWPTWL